MARRFSWIKHQQFGLKALELAEKYARKGMVNKMEKELRNIIKHRYRLINSIEKNIEAKKNPLGFILKNFDLISTDFWLLNFEKFNAIRTLGYAKLGREIVDFPRISIQENIIDAERILLHK